MSAVMTLPSSSRERLMFWASVRVKPAEEMSWASLPPQPPQPTHIPFADHVCKEDVMTTGQKALRMS